MRKCFVVFHFSCVVVVGLWFCEGFVGIRWWWCGSVVLVLESMGSSICAVKGLVVL